MSTAEHYAAPGEPPEGGGYREPFTREHRDVPLRTPHQPTATEHPVSVRILGHRDEPGMRQLNPTEPDFSHTPQTRRLPHEYLSWIAAEAAVRAHLTGRHEMAFAHAGQAPDPGRAMETEEAALAMSDPEGRVVMWPRVVSGGWGLMHARDISRGAYHYVTNPDQYGAMGPEDRRLHQQTHAAALAAGRQFAQVNISKHPEFQGLLRSAHAGHEGALNALRDWLEEHGYPGGAHVHYPLHETLPMVARPHDEPTPYAATHPQEPFHREHRDVPLRAPHQPQAAEHPISIQVLGERDHPGVRALNPEPTFGPTMPIKYLQTEQLNRAATEAAVRAHLSGKHEMAFARSALSEGNYPSWEDRTKFLESALLMSDPQGRVVAWPKLTNGNQFTHQAIRDVSPAAVGYF